VTSSYMMCNSRGSLQTDFSQVLTQVLCCEDPGGSTFNASMIRKDNKDTYQSK